MRGTPHVTKGGKMYHGCAHHNDPGCHGRRRRYSTVGIAGASVCLLLLTASCRHSDAEPYRESRAAHGALIQAVTFFPSDETEHSPAHTSAIRAAESATDRSVAILSEVARFHAAMEDAGARDSPAEATGNGRAERTRFPAFTPELREMVSRAFEISDVTAGAFDPIVAPLVSLWGFHGESPAVPRVRDIEKALGLVEEAESHAGGLRSGDGVEHALDLRGIAYGEAADAGARMLSDTLREGESPTPHSWLIDVGGHVRVGAGKPAGEAFRVGIRSPLHEPAVHLAVLELRDAAVSTVGRHQGFFVEEGIRYHHILNPATGFPVANGLLSVTVTAELAATADAMATGCFVLGLDDGYALVESLDGVEALFVDRRRRIHATPGIRQTLTDVHAAYRLVE